MSLTFERHVQRAYVLYVLQEADRPLSTPEIVSRVNDMTLGDRMNAIQRFEARFGEFARE